MQYDWLKTRWVATSWYVMLACNSTRCAMWSWSTFCFWYFLYKLRIFSSGTERCAVSTKQLRFLRSFLWYSSRRFMRNEWQIGGRARSCRSPLGVVGSGSMGLWKNEAGVQTGPPGLQRSMNRTRRFQHLPSLPGEVAGTGNGWLAARQPSPS